MLTDKDLGIQKFILDRITQIDEEIVQNDPEYKERGERPGELAETGCSQTLPGRRYAVERVCQYLL